MAELSDYDFIFSCIKKDEDTLLCCEGRPPMLTSMNVHTGEMQILSMENMDLPADWIPWMDAVIDGDYIYVLKYWGKSICRISLRNGACKEYWLGMNRTPDKVKPSLKMFMYHRKIYVMPKLDDLVFVLDIDTGNVRKIKLLAGDKTAIFSGCLRLGNDILLFAAERKGSSAVIFSLDKEIALQKLLPEAFFGVEHVQCYDQKIYFTKSDNSLFVSDFNCEKVELILKAGEENNEIGVFAVTKKNIWLLPARGSRILIYDYDSKTAQEYNDYPADYQYSSKSGKTYKFSGYTEDENTYYFANRWQNYMLMINRNSGQGHWIDPHYPSDENRIQFKIKYCQNQGKVLCEEEVPFSVYIRAIAQN